MSIPLVTMRVHCSKGTYIRTLCHDIGERLGVGGMMKSLIRTRVSHFTAEKAVTLAQVEEHRDNGTLDQILLPVDGVFASFPELHIEEHAVKRLQNGNRLKRGDFSDTDAPGTPKADTQFRVYDNAGRFYGIYGYDEMRKDYCCIKMF